MDHLGIGLVGLNSFGNNAADTPCLMVRIVLGGVGTTKLINKPGEHLGRNRKSSTMTGQILASRVFCACIMLKISTECEFSLGRGGGTSVGFSNLIP